MQELNLARSAWLSDSSLKSIAASSPQIGKSSLEQDTELSYIAFGELEKFLGLKSLNLGLCHQIQDADLALIVQACPGLTD